MRSVITVEPRGAVGGHWWGQPSWFGLVHVGGDGGNVLESGQASGRWLCRWALKVTRGSRGGTRCIQVSSNRNLRFIYKTKSKQGTNERNLVEGLRKESAECLSKESAECLSKESAECLSKESAECLSKESAECLSKESAECLSKRTLVLQSLCRGNRKELSYLEINLSGYP